MSFFSLIINERQIFNLDDIDIRPVSAVFWPEASPVAALGDHCMWDTRLCVGTCGDWCGGPRVEGAFLSVRLLKKILFTIDRL